MTTYKPKLIEVALPLADLSEASSKEKSVKHGHPANLHQWWARRPLAAARGVIWASLVDDPSGDDSLSRGEQDRERERLFDLLRRLVLWENSGDAEILKQARREIEKSYPSGPPPVLDPFGGGGAIPLEAQRLGLDVLAGDLNPVAVLIQRSVMELPSRFSGMRPVNETDRDNLTTWDGAQGLAADVQHYGLALRDIAAQEVGDLYRDCVDENGRHLKPIAWIWARTVESPDPSWGGHVPLVGSWVLAKKGSTVKAWIEPVVDRDRQSVNFEIRRSGKPTISRTCSGGTGRCLATGATIPAAYIKEESRAGRMGVTLMAVVAEGEGGRVYLPPTAEGERLALTANPSWVPASPLPAQGLGFRVQAYGMTQWSDLFSSRQLSSLSALSDALPQITSAAEADAKKAGLPDDRLGVAEGGAGARAYSEAIVTYLAFAIDKLADLANSLSAWEPVAQCPRHLFGRQTIPMVWDFAEGNPFGTRSGSFEVVVSGIRRVLEGKGIPIAPTGNIEIAQRDARSRVKDSSGALVSTDPPYYDNVGYADLSDFFFVWLRHNLSSVWPDECATLLSPKSEELIADPGRHGGGAAASVYFESGMSDFMAELARAHLTNTPATIYYAYKATEIQDGQTRSTGWSTFLQSVVDAGLMVTATWPLRTENKSRLRAMNSNALASSIVLVCRKRPTTASLASRGEFVSALNAELPLAVRLLQSGNVAPVDLPQSTIGPGIGIFSRYAKVVEADGRAMPVSDALAIINDVLSQVLDGEEAELDADTRFAATWYSQHGHESGPSGDADGLARAKDTSLAGIAAAGIGEARGGSFRLFDRSELKPGWDPVKDNRRTVWEATQHLIAALERSETEAAELLHRMGGYANRARQLAYVLFQKATDKGWADEAGAYNGLITAWPSLQAIGGSGDAQGSLL